MALNPGVLEHPNDDLISKQLFSERELTPFFTEAHTAFAVKVESMLDQWLDRILDLIEEVVEK